MNTNRQAAPRGASSRKIALAAGILYLLTFVSIPTLAIYGSVKSANYILGTGPDTSAIIGGIPSRVAGGLLPSSRCRPRVPEHALADWVTASR